MNHYDTTLFNERMLLIISNSKIIVIDSIMGSGKTSWAIQEINAHKERKYIYITPLLSEIQRIQSSVETRFYDPKNFGNGKLEDLNRLLCNGYNIASTHVLFSRITEETQLLLSQGKYTLILDEVLDVVEPYKELKKGDMRFLINEKLISIDNEIGYVSWNPDKQHYSDYKYYETMLLANNRSLVYIDGTIVRQFPPQVFSMFENVYVMTYQFAGQVMRAYFDFHGFEYDYRSVQNTEGKYELTTFDSQNGNRFSPLINILDDYKLNHIGYNVNALSKRWYKNASKESIQVLKNNMTNYFTNKTQAKSSSIMWTTFKNYKFKLSGRGYTKAHSKSELPQNPTEDDLKKAECFVPLNCRATNLYSERRNLAYMVNRYPQPYIKKFFARRNIQFDDDLFALSEMLQWIWRSAIRNQEKINIYIPSRRMREMLISWLNTKI